MVMNNVLLRIWILLEWKIIKGGVYTWSFAKLDKRKRRTRMGKKKRKLDFRDSGSTNGLGNENLILYSFYILPLICYFYLLLLF